MTNDLNDQYLKYQQPVRKHHIQSLWQIWIPLIVIILLLAGTFVTAMILSDSGSLNLGQVENAALIFMILPMVLVGVLSFIALLMAIFVTSRAMKIIPRLHLISVKLDAITSGITTWSNRLMLPFVVANRLKARLSISKKKQ